MIIVYISGRYRVYDGEFLDAEAMNVQVEHEKTWARVVLESGHFPICPLSNSIPLEDMWGADKWIRGDLLLLGRLRPGVDAILMRPGWDSEPESVGARREYDKAVRQGLIVIDKMNPKTVLEFLRDIMSDGRP